MFSNKTILITGGSGTIGSALTEYLLLNCSPKVIRIYSRDETKQYFLNNKLKNFQEKLRFFIGDIRDKERVNRAMKDVDIVLHLAALKHVGVCEYNPFEAIKTNIIGLQNLLEVSIDNDIEKFLYTSTDKAANPSNTMGVTKLLGEKLVTAANFYKGSKRSIFYSVRFGNVLGSRGSLIPSIREQIKNNFPISLTHPEMTRYIMGNESAIKLIIKTMKIAQGGEIFVLKINAVRIIDLIEVLIENFSELYNKKPESVQINEIGLFAGEKLYEELFSLEESERIYEMDDMYLILPQLPELHKMIVLGKYTKLKKFDKEKPFNSKEEDYLSKKEIRDFLIQNKIMN